MSNSKLVNYTKISPPPDKPPAGEDPGDLYPHHGWAWERRGVRRSLPNLGGLCPLRHRAGWADRAVCPGRGPGLVL